MALIQLVKGIIGLLIKVFNVFIHSLGLYLLNCLSRRGKGNVQMIYIMNLSATELIINMFSFSRNLVRLLPSLETMRQSHKYRDVEMYSYILDYQLKFCLYMWMLYITIDRVCGVLLNLNYSQYWSETKAKLLVGATWTVAFSFMIYMCVMFTLDRLRDEKHMHAAQLFQIANYVVMVMDFSFVVTAACAYIFIFYRYQRSRLNRFLSRKASVPSKSCGGGGGKNVWGLFRRSRFYVSVLLISTYLVFTILPDLLWTFGVVERNNLQFLMTIMYATSHMADGLIYIFMHERVKKMFFRKVKRNRFLAGIFQVCFCTPRNRTDSFYPIDAMYRNSKEKTKWCGDGCSSTPLSSTSSSLKERPEHIRVQGGGLILPSSLTNPHTKSRVVHAVSANLESIFFALPYQRRHCETSL